MPVDDIVALLKQIHEFMKENNFSSPLFIDLQGTKMRLSNLQNEFLIHTHENVKIFSETSYKSLNEKDKETYKNVFLFTDDVYSLIVDHMTPNLEVNIDDAKITLCEFSISDCKRFINSKVLKTNNNEHTDLKCKGSNIDW